MTETHPEYQYLNLVNDIIKTGSREETRNGTTLSKFGASMRFSLRDGILPLLTTKKVGWKTCFNELRWFIRGDTNNNNLQRDNVHIWDGNATREFLDSRGLHHYDEGCLGPIYGHQWRHFNAEYKGCDDDYKGCGIDQLRNIIDNLKTPEGRTSRRLVMSAWNPCQLDEMALPPCHILTQFNVREGKYLSCSMYQRSCDMGLGVPFNIASYSFLTHLLAKHCDLEPDEFIYFLGNVHIYESHIEPLLQQIERKPFDFPMIKIKDKRDKIEDYTTDDIEWATPYNHRDTIVMKMCV